jgi:hypothetical protein
MDEDLEYTLHIIVPALLKLKTIINQAHGLVTPPTGDVPVPITDNTIKYFRQLDINPYSDDEDVHAPTVHLEYPTDVVLPTRFLTIFDAANNDDEYLNTKYLDDPGT